MLVDGYAFGSLSMACYGVGCECPGNGEGAGSAPLGSSVPPEGSNI